MWQESETLWVDVTGLPRLPVSPPTPRAVVLKFQDKKESAVLVLQNSCIREESLGFFPQCHPQTHSARASLGEQAKGLSSPRQSPTEGTQAFERDKNLDLVSQNSAPNYNPQNELVDLYIKAISV